MCRPLIAASRQFRETAVGATQARGAERVPVARVWPERVRGTAPCGASEFAEISGSRPRPYPSEELRASDIITSMGQPTYFEARGYLAENSASGAYSSTASS